VRSAIELRQIAGKRDHREIMLDGDYLVLRPGPNLSRAASASVLSDTSELKSAPMRRNARVHHGTDFEGPPL